MAGFNQASPLLRPLLWCSSRRRREDLLDSTVAIPHTPSSPLHPMEDPFLHMNFFANEEDFLLKGKLFHSKRVRSPRAQDFIKKPRQKFFWPPELHQAFIGAIFDLGLMHSKNYLSNVHDAILKKRMESGNNESSMFSENLVRREIRIMQEFRALHGGSPILQEKAPEHRLHHSKRRLKCAPREHLKRTAFDTHHLVLKTNHSTDSETSSSVDFPLESVDDLCDVLSLNEEDSLDFLNAMIGEV